MFVCILKIAKQSVVWNNCNKTRDKRVCWCMCWIDIFIHVVVGLICLVFYKYKGRIIYFLMLGLYTVCSLAT